MAVKMHDDRKSPANDWLLWAGVLAGPLAWALDEGLSYSTAQHDCSTGHFYVMHVITLACLLLALAGAWTARMQLSRVGEGEENGGTPRDRSWWMARLGIALGLGFSLVIVAMAVPKFLLNPCD